MSSDANTQQQPTEDQIVEARFEAVKVVTAVAERVLLNPYERQIIIQACALSLQGLQAEYARIKNADSEGEDNLQDEDEDKVEISFDDESEEPAESDESEDVE